MAQKLASMCGRPALSINMNSACLKCGSSLVHLVMTSTPLKLVGRHVYISFTKLLNVPSN